MTRPPPRLIARRLLDGLAAVLVLVSLTVAVMWLRSFHAPEHLWVCYRSGRIDALKVHRGEFTFARRQTPYRLRKTAAFRESGRQVEPRLVTGSYPVERRWGPLVYAAAPPAPQPTGEQALRVREQLRAAQAFDAVAWPDDPQERREWTARRARAYREALRAERHQKSANASVWLVSVPGWLLLLALAAVPAARAAPAWRRWRAWRGSRRRACDHCGGELAAGAACHACAVARDAANRDVAVAPAPAEVVVPTRAVDDADAPRGLPVGFDLPRRVPYRGRPGGGTRPPPRRPRRTP